MFESIEGNWGWFLFGVALMSGVIREWTTRRKNKMPTFKGVDSSALVSDHVINTIVDLIDTDENLLETFMEKVFVRFKGDHSPINALNDDVITELVEDLGDGINIEEFIAKMKDKFLEVNGDNKNL